MWYPSFAISNDCEIATQEVVASDPFQLWLGRLRPNLVTRVRVTGAGMWGHPAAIELIHLEVEYRKPDGSVARAYISLRNDTVDVLAIVRCDRLQYVVFVKQPRLAAGGADVLSNVAGGIKLGESPEKAARRELDEELGITLDWGRFVDMGAMAYRAQMPTIVTPGTLSEQTFYLVAQAHVTPDQLAELQDRTAGLEEEGELTRVVVRLLNGAIACLPHDGVVDGKTLASLGLYDHCCRLPEWLTW